MIASVQLDFENMQATNAGEAVQQTGRALLAASIQATMAAAIYWLLSMIVTDIALSFDQFVWGTFTLQLTGLMLMIVGHSCRNPTCVVAKTGQALSLIALIGMMLFPVLNPLL